MAKKKKRNYDNPVWKMKDGTEIRLEDMEDSHLINCPRMMERTFPLAREACTDAAWDAACFFQGEMAQMSAENAASEYVSMREPGDMWPVYNDMIKEMDRRPFARSLYYAEEEYKKHAAKR